MTGKKRYKRRALFVMALVLWAGFFAHAQERAGEPLTLNQALDTAAANNPSLISSYRRWEEKRRGIAITNGWPMPEAGIMFEDIPSNSINPTNGMMSEFSLSQEIMNPLKLIAMRDMSKSEAGMAGADYHNNQMRVYAVTKQAYYDFLYAQKAVAIMRENLDLMRQFNTVTETNYANGVSPIQDTLRSQTEVSKMEIEIINMEAMTLAARNRLNYLLGRPAGTPLAIQEEFSANIPELNAAELEEKAQISPALQSMSWDVEMAKNKLFMAKTELAPDFKIDFSWVRSKVMDPMLMSMSNMTASAMGPAMAQYPVHGVNDYSLEMAETTKKTWKIGFMVMIPLWFGQYKAKIDSASEGVQAARAALLDMRNMTGMELSMAVNDAQSSRRLINLYNNTVIPQAEQTYRAVIVGYTNGRENFMSVMDSLTALRDARLDYYKARVDYEKALANLEKIAGLPLFQNSESGETSGTNKEQKK
jgi:outer membrane protein TolC